MHVISLHEALERFSETLTTSFAVAELNPAQAEDQLKGPIQRLLSELGTELGVSVVARSEARTDLGVRPDMGVSVQKLLAGHVELKAPGKGARPAGFNDRHDKEQFKKLADHPNLLYSDGNEWALYRRGQLVGALVRAEGDVRTDGPAAYGQTGKRALATLLRDFLSWEPLVPATPKAPSSSLR